MFPNDLKYAKSHEWVRLEDDTATIGLSDFAIKQLSDLVFIDLPEVGSEITAGEPFGEIESVKAVSDLYAPITGTILEVNAAIGDNPEKLSEDAYQEGWLIKVKASNQSELNALLNSDDYLNVTEEDNH